MKRLVIAAAIGLGLLAGGGTLGSAMARPVHQDTSHNPGVLAVHYEHSEHEWPRSYGYDRW